MPQQPLPGWAHLVLSWLIKLFTTCCLVLQAPRRRSLVPALGTPQCVRINRFQLEGVLGALGLAEALDPTEKPHTKEYSLRSVLLLSLIGPFTALSQGTLARVREAGLLRLWPC